MREILFRGKRKDNGEWIVGHLLRYEDGRARIIESRTDIFCFADDPDTTVAKTYEVAPETIGQFTGRTAKNRKKIFEGDILSNANVKGVVFFSDESACFMLKWKNFDRFREDFFKECRLTDFVLIEYMEVIGNIHDNPELLGGGKSGD